MILYSNFVSNILPQLKAAGYNVSERTILHKDYYKDGEYGGMGDFGDLTQIEFEGKGTLGGISFWSSDVLEIYVLDTQIKTTSFAEDEDVIMNLLFFAEEIKEQKKAIKELLTILLSR